MRDKRLTSPYKLPGGGPWKIDESCLSTRHNTTYASRGYYVVDGKIRTNGIVCTCPRSKMLIEHQREQARGYYHKRNEDARVMPVWWTGPWLIRDDCPATGHNILTRALRPRDGKRCICPRANALKYAHNLASSEQQRQKRRAQINDAVNVDKEKGPEINVRSLRANEVRNYNRPDMSKGACVTDPGVLQVFDHALEAVAHTGPALKARNAAKWVCAECPIRVACAGWTLQNEEPAGSWGGVLGGMDPWERAAEMERRSRDVNGDGAVHAAESAVRSDEGTGERDDRASEEDGGGGVPEGARPGGEVLPGRALPHRRTLRAHA